MERFLKRAWAEIDLDSVVHNYNEAKKILPPATKIMAVLKADANNIGDLALSEVLDQFSDDWYAVSNIREAIMLREHGTVKPILVLGYTPPSLVDLLAEFKITQTLVSADYAILLSQAAAQINTKIDVHIKLDTGMSRIGLMCYDGFFESFMSKCKAIFEDPYLSVSGVFTHIATFYNLDISSNDFTQLQYKRFIEACAALKDNGYDVGLRHCCNSPGMVNHPEMVLDMVRIGTALFGGLVEEYKLRSIPFKQCLTIKAAISCVKTVNAGAYLGYGRTFQATHDIRVVTLSIGYSDICRIGVNTGQVLIGEEICQVIGGVCMDQLMVDVSQVESVEIGDEAILLGKSTHREISLETFAKFMDTDPEEAYCHLTKRLPHLYFKEGQPRYWVEYVPKFFDMSGDSGGRGRSHL